MDKVLYITANPKSDEQSFSLSVGNAFLEAYRSEKPEDEIINLDLYNVTLPYIDTDVFSGWGKLQQGHAFDQLTEDEKSKVAMINHFTDQFIGCDKYIFVTPLWNFSFPPKVKAYIDTICIAGKTFKYTQTGPVGLLTDKKALHIQARGGVYSEGPAKELEFGDRYLRAIFSFIGITDVHSIVAEGMAQNPDQAESIKAQAVAEAQAYAKVFANDIVQVPKSQ